MFNSEQYSEFMAQKEKIKELEARNEFLKAQYDQLNEDYQKADEDKAALIKERDRLTNIVHSRGSEEAYSPDNNTVIKIKNLYFTNNYISEEDKDD